jgi:hypothetical protein
MPRYFLHSTRTVPDQRLSLWYELSGCCGGLSTAESKIRELRKQSWGDDPTLMMIETGQAVLSLPFFPGY